MSTRTDTPVFDPHHPAPRDARDTDRTFCANYVRDVLGAERAATPAALLRSGTLSLEFDGIVFDPARP